jgi:hypothetical protein
MLASVTLMLTAWNGSRAGATMLTSFQHVKYAGRNVVEKPVARTQLDVLIDVAPKVLYRNDFRRAAETGDVHAKNVAALIVYQWFAFVAEELSDIARADIQPAFTFWHCCCLS